MKLYRKVYENINSQVCVYSPWYRNEHAALYHCENGESYMVRSPSFKIRIEEQIVGLLVWLRREA